MPKVESPRPSKAGPYSRLPLTMPGVGAVPKGRELYVGRGGQWVLGRVVRWFGKADDSRHWYELAFAHGGATEWFDLSPARRAIGTAAGGSWAFPEDEDISPACARRLGGGADDAESTGHRPRSTRGFQYSGLPSAQYGGATPRAGARAGA